MNLNTFNFNLFAGLLKFELKNPNIPGKWLAIMGVGAFITSLIAFVAMAWFSLWAINTLFSLDITVTLKNIIIAAVLIAIIRQR